MSGHNGYLHAIFLYNLSLDWCPQLTPQSSGMDQLRSPITDGQLFRCSLIYIIQCVPWMRKRPFKGHRVRRFSAITEPFAASKSAVAR
jgi:hypothetical protein